MSERTRLEIVTAWIAWHLGELAVVTITLFLAVHVSWWFLVGTAAFGAVWAIPEWRHHRLRVRARAQRQLATPADGDAAPEAVVHVLPREGA